MEDKVYVFIHSTDSTARVFHRALMHYIGEGEHSYTYTVPPCKVGAPTLEVSSCLSNCFAPYKEELLSSGFGRKMNVANKTLSPPAYLPPNSLPQNSGVLHQHLHSTLHCRLTWSKPDA